MNSRVPAPAKRLFFWVCSRWSLRRCGRLSSRKDVHRTHNRKFGARSFTIAAHDWQGALSHFSALACFMAGIPLSVLIARLTAAGLPGR